MSGAIREDDNLTDGAFDDPYVPKHAFNRVFNHFFDPTRNRPLKLTPKFDSDPDQFVLRERHILQCVRLHSPRLGAWIG